MKVSSTVFAETHCPDMVSTFQSVAHIREREISWCLVAGRSSLYLCARVCKSLSSVGKYDLESSNASKLDLCVSRSVEP